MKPRPTELDAATSASRHAARSAGDEWRTALTCIEPNKILVRGYPLDEINQGYADMLEGRNIRGVITFS